MVLSMPDALLTRSRPRSKSFMNHDDQTWALRQMVLKSRSLFFSSIVAGMMDWEWS